MAKPRSKNPVSELVSAGNLPPTAVVQRVITYYVNHRDLKLAAAQAGLMPEMGELLYKEPKVRALIDRKILLVDMEEAKLKAKANLLTVSLLDASLAEEVKSKKNGHIRVRAIELGYRRTGMIRDGEFIGVQSGGSGGPSSVKTYGQIQTTTMRRTTTEELVQSSETAVQVSTGNPAVETRLMQPDVQDY